MVRRHPHVFSDTKVSGSAEVLENWEAQKAAEKGRTSATEGVPLGQPALALATKLIYRAQKYGHQIAIEHPLKLAPNTSEKELGAVLLGVLDQALALDIDPEAALRSAIKGYIEQIKKYESKYNHRGLDLICHLLHLQIKQEIKKHFIRWCYWLYPWIRSDHGGFTWPFVGGD